MNFASYEFWKVFFLCFVASRLLLAGVRRLRPNDEAAAGKLLLLLTALTLLTSESWLTLGAFAWVVLLGWGAIQLIARARHSRGRTFVLALVLVLQLLPLLYFKYWNFLFNDILGLGVRVPSVLIPMGLSFYTFQMIGFWIDAARRPGLLPRFLDYLNFASFFPQIVAGPIERSDALLPQVREIRFRVRRANLEPALQWIVLGLAYKLVVADNIAALSDKFRIDPSNAWHVWFECLVFGIRIYFDFAGYSFIAVGLGAAFGVTLTLNFRSPYWALDLQQFWRDWHISLGSWMRDYIYLPLGGGRVPWYVANILVVFLVSGVWHGAGWGFLVWGLLHGIGVATAGLWRKILSFAPVRWLATFAYATAAWLFFLERDTAAMWTKAASLVRPSAYLGEAAKRFHILFTNPTNMATTAFVLSLAALALVLEGIGIRRQLEPYGILRRPFFSVILVVMIVWLAPLEESSFIYFNF